MDGGPSFVGLALDQVVDETGKSVMPRQLFVRHQTILPR